MPPFARATTTWRKSSYSGNGGPDCVEVTLPSGPAGVGVRNSRVPDDHEGYKELWFRHNTWAAFVSWAKS